MKPETCTVFASSLAGITGSLATIVATIERGPAELRILGLAESSVRETRIRVRSCLPYWSDCIINIEITPAGVHNERVLDLAIVIAALGGLGEFAREAVARTIFLGGLSSSGAVLPVRGVFPALRAAVAEGARRAIVPRGNAAEAARVPGLDVRVAEHLHEVTEHLRGGCRLERASAPSATQRTAEVDLADIPLPASTRRALEIAAAGQHSMLLVAPPGGGSMAAALRLPSILPPMSEEEAVEVTAIHSVAGLLDDKRGVVAERPFRVPHHSLQAARLVGSGEPVMPGEVSLAHGGVLFLDQVAAFRRSARDALARVLEAGVHAGSRRMAFPARPLLVAAAHGCPCGFRGDPKRRCTCSPECLQRYWERMRGPLFDWIDMEVVLPPVDVVPVRGKARRETSEAVRARVAAARGVQIARWKRRDVRARVNSELSEEELGRVVGLDACSQMLRVARTIADLDGSEAVRGHHLDEARSLARH